MTQPRTPRLARVVWWLMRKAGANRSLFASAPATALANAARMVAYARGDTWVAPVHVVLACDPAADQLLTQTLAGHGIEVTRVTQRLLAAMESPPRSRSQNVDPAAWRGPAVFELGRLGSFARRTTRQPHECIRALRVWTCFLRRSASSVNRSPPCSPIRALRLNCSVRLNLKWRVRTRLRDRLSGHRHRPHSRKRKKP